jgi:hypothetical protein
MKDFAFAAQTYCDITNSAFLDFSYRSLSKKSGRCPHLPLFVVDEALFVLTG